MSTAKSNYSEAGAKFSYKTGRSPREIFKEVSAQEPRKKAVFARSHHKKMTSSHQSRKMDSRKFCNTTLTLETNSGAKHANPRPKGAARGGGRGKTHSFKSETGEFGSVSRKDFGRLEYGTSAAGTWKTREKALQEHRSKAKGKSSYAKRPEKPQLEAVMPECVSIYKKLKVDAIPRKGDSGKASTTRKEGAKSRGVTLSRSKKPRAKEGGGYSKAAKKREAGRSKKKSLVDGRRLVQGSLKTTPERPKQSHSKKKLRADSKKSKTGSRDPRTQSKAREKPGKAKGKSEGKSEKGESVRRGGLKKKSKSRKKNASFDKKKFSPKNTFQEKKSRGGASKKKRRLQRSKKAKRLRDLTSKISQTMSKAERTAREVAAFHKHSLQTSRHLGESSSSKLREKSHSTAKPHFKNRLHKQEPSRGAKAKSSLSLQKSLRKQVSIERSRNKRPRKVSKKNSIALKNLSELTKGLRGNVKVIYKGHRPAKGRSRGAKGLYTEDPHVFADLKEGVEREQFIGHRHSKLIYKKERGSRKDRSEKRRQYRELPRLEAAVLGEEAPNIYNQQSNLKQSQTPKENASESSANLKPKFINVNEKRVRVSGLRAEKSLQRRRKLASGRKLSGLNRTALCPKSGDEEPDTPKGPPRLQKTEQSRVQPRALHRGSLGKRKVGSQSQLYGRRTQGDSKPNIYQKIGPELQFPKSEIEFEGKQVQNSIYLKSEEIVPEGGTTGSEKTENSLACRENIGKALLVSNSPEPVASSDRRRRQSTKAAEPPGNAYFEHDGAGLDYAKSEDLEGERRIANQNTESGLGSAHLVSNVGAQGDRGKQEATEAPVRGEEEKKMKLSQSEAGSWKGGVKPKFKGARSGDLGLASLQRVASPDLGSSPQRPSAEQQIEESGLAVPSSPPVRDSRQAPPMEFEVDPGEKFDSMGKGNLSSSNRTNKFKYGGQNQSNATLLGESDFTVGKKLSARAFGYQSGKAEFEMVKQSSEEKAIEESSEEGEDLIITNSVALGPDLDLEAHEQLPEKDLEERGNQLEAVESLGQDVASEKKLPKQGLAASNYVTLKVPSNLRATVSPNFSEKEVKRSKTKAASKRRRKKSQMQQKRPRVKRTVSSRKKMKGAKSRSSSKVKLYKMTSEKTSTLNNSASRSRKESKTKWSGKKISRKREIGRLLDKYSREDNSLPEEKPKGGFDQVASKAFSLTFRKNLHQRLAEARAKPSKAKKTDKEVILRKCREFKHETQSNLFEVETLNTLTTAEDDYVAKPEYLTLNQPFLDAKVRTVLMGWMGEVSEDLWFCRDTFHMSCNYVDRFLQLTPKVPKDQLQLIGLTCLYIASKMEEVQMRNVNDYLSSACNIYTEEQMMKCEIKIITVLDFRLNPPTLNLWANWYMNQWDNFVISDSFVQEHPMIRDSHIVAQFKQGNEESYNLYREFMQYLGKPSSNARLRRAGHPDARVQAVPAGALVHVHRAGHEVPAVHAGPNRGGVPDELDVPAGRGGVRLQQLIRLLHVLLLRHRAHRPAAHHPVREHLLLLLHRAATALHHRLQARRNLGRKACALLTEGALRAVHQLPNLEQKVCRLRRQIEDS